MSCYRRSFKQTIVFNNQVRVSSEEFKVYDLDRLISITFKNWLLLLKSLTFEHTFAKRISCIYHDVASGREIPPCNNYTLL